MKRRTFLTGITGTLAVLGGCVTNSTTGPSDSEPTSEQPKTPDSTSPTTTMASSTETPLTNSQLPAVCANGIRFKNLSSASQKEFKTALKEEGLTRSTLNFSIVNETKDDNGLYTIGDEIGAEICILYDGTYYFGTVGPGIPVSPQENGSNEFRYTLQFERAKRYNTVIETSSD